MATSSARNIAPQTPLITFLTDFGTSDAYVAAMKMAVWALAPSCQLIDITHSIAPQDIQGGSIILERAIADGIPGAVHVAVVDPGVGTDRRIIVTQINQQTVICPDNGLITWAWRRMQPGAIFELTWRPEKSSQTFQGRDIMAPAAGMLAGGWPLRTLARPITDPILLELDPAPTGARQGTIIQIDHFGNAMTNISRTVAESEPCQVRIGKRRIGTICRNYSDVAPGRALALIGSADLLEIAVREGSAARKLGLKRGDIVYLDGTQLPR